MMDKKEYDRLRYIRRGEEAKLQMKENYLREKKENPVAQMLRRLRARAKIKNLEFSLTAEDISIPEVCPILGISLKENNPSLDRVDNTKGYIKSNVRVVSNRANTLKRDASLEELERIVEYMRRPS